MDMPARQLYNPIMHPGRNVMALWPEAWDSADNQQWANALPWEPVAGSRGDVRADTGYDAHVLNFAFNSLYDVRVHPEPRRRPGLAL